VRRRIAAALLCATIAPGCTCQRASDGSATPAPPATTEGDASAPARTVVIDFVRDLDRCALGHRGVLLDLGDPMTKDSLHPGSLAPGKDERIEHEGATWLRVRARALTMTFYWSAGSTDAPEAAAYVEARVRGLTARGVAVLLDGKPAGSWALGKGETRIQVARPVVPVALTPGAHELSLRFIGGPRASDEPLAEIDWVHVGTGETGEAYSAPTRLDAVLDTTVGGRSLRALSLRAPGSVRCSGWLPADATLEASLATVGGGEADVEARLLRDRHAPVVLGTAHVTGSGVAWAPWSVPVTGLEGDGALGSLELVARRATKGTRLLLGEPRVVVTGSTALPAPPAARGVVVVVLGSTSARSLSPWGGPHPAAELAKLASTGTTFLSNRAVSSLANADLGSMLTGLPPLVLGLDEPDVRLPKGPTTLEEALRQGGVATALFTANPTTGPVFGFDRGWDTLVAHDPLDGMPATQVFDDAAGWIEAHKADRFLVVIHARGGHPPWEASAEELKTMPPEGYLGVVEPQRAAEVLGKARKHPARLKDDDRARAWALYDRAVDAHDAALGRLVTALRAAGRDGDTAVIVTGDVAATEGPPLPFVDVDTLDEPILATPLVVRWPQDNALAGRRVEAPSSPLDIARTAMGALGMSPPEAFRGIDLATLARGALVPAQRPMAASRAGRSSIRWGTSILLASRERETRLCDVALDPACVADVRATTPLALEPLHRWAVDNLAAPPAPYPREPAVIDARTLSILVRWGRPTDDRDPAPN
jgi:hypothetical protein